METGLLRDFFGNFSTRGERYYFTPGEIEPMQGEIETNIGKLRNSDKLKFPFWVEGTFGDDIWWGGGGGGASGPVGGRVSGSRRSNSREPDGAGAVGARKGGEGWQGAGGPDGSCSGWLGRRWVVMQEGQIAGVVGQEGDGREPDGVGELGARRARWLGREGMTGCRRARW